MFIPWGSLIITIGDLTGPLGFHISWMMLTVSESERDQIFIKTHSSRVPRVWWIYLTGKLQAIILTYISHQKSSWIKPPHSQRIISGVNICRALRKARWDISLSWSLFVKSNNLKLSTRPSPGGNYQGSTCRQLTRQHIHNNRATNWQQINETDRKQI